MENRSGGTLSVTMFTPWHSRCGIRDYSAHLLDALNRLEDIAHTEVVAAPQNQIRSDLGAALRSYAANMRRFKTLGARMNRDADGRPADVAHIQHQYFCFGGVAPYKTQIVPFLNRINIPIVMTVHEITPDAGSLVQRTALALANTLNFAHPAIRTLIVHTDTDRQRLIEIGISAGKIRVVRHGVPEAAPMPDANTAKRALGLEGRHVVTLFGFLSQKKGHPIALASLSHLPDNVVLLFAGDRHPEDSSDYVPRMRAVIDYNNLQDRVKITGYVPDALIPEIMAATDVAIAPFVHTSGSGSLANLLAYGRAVAASDIPPHKEVIASAPGVFDLFESGSPTALADSVLRILTDPGHRLALGSAALGYAAHHSYDAMARETAAIYHAALR